MQKKILLFLLVLLGWFALIAQFDLLMQNRTASIPESIVRYFSFFTVLTNLLVVLCFSFILTKSHSSLSHFFSSTKILTAIVVYITVVGVVYNIILRFLWQPRGLQFIVDELLHTVIPLLCIVYWIAFVSKLPAQMEGCLCVAFISGGIHYLYFYSRKLFRILSLSIY
ncbi:MAG: Pr6Pr family membrane protein [Ginsengibacter sp.]